MLKIKLKKDGLKNIYCDTCKRWMNEFYVSRHLQSKSHFMKKNVEKRKYKKQNKRGNQKPKVVKKGPKYEHYRIQGKKSRNRMN